jgi:hypothetical protein
MGKYWYQDDNKKWRIGDDTDDTVVALLTFLTICLGWVLWKPISWWLLHREEPTTWQIILWWILVAIITFIIISLCC